jgi:hypothetical protein
MKLPQTISKTRRAAGILLTECLVYLAVFVIVLGGAATVFYFCWDHSKALIYTTEDISSALRAGERWRADVRGATGKISAEATPGGEVLRIPRGKDEVFYSFHDGAVRRKLASSDFTELVFAKVNASQMKMDARGDVTAWCWELQLTERRKEIHLPLRFTFEAAQMKP